MAIVNMAKEAAPERETLAAKMAGIGRAARAAAKQLALADAETKNEALNAAAKAIRASTVAILAANGKDIEAARAAGRPSSFLDRLTLTPQRIEVMAKGLEEIAALPDPVGEMMASWTRPNGLVIERVRVPLGVIGMIYESRPNVTADAGGLCLKSGNAVILRGGSDGAELEPRDSCGAGFGAVSMPGLRGGDPTRRQPRSRGGRNDARRP